MSDPAVVWHDVECGSYAADLPLWRELAAASAGPVLDVGAGAGRVALDLARHGHEVVAIDSDPVLLAALGERCAGLPVRAQRADARSFALDEAFGLCLAPMQLVQLLGGAGDRAEFLRRAREHLGPRGVIAVALADPMSGWDPDPDDPATLPLPDMTERDGCVYSSQPVAVRVREGRTEIERVRQRVGPGGETESHTAIVRLDRVEASGLEAEARACGLTALERRAIPETAEHVGSEVVLLTA